MFSEFAEKFNSFAGHHQVIFTIMIAFCIIAISWGIEKLLEEHVFYKHPLPGYLIAIFGGLLTLWIIKHIILHSM